MLLSHPSKSLCKCPHHSIHIGRILRQPSGIPGSHSIKILLTHTHQPFLYLQIHYTSDPHHANIYHLHNHNPFAFAPAVIPGIHPPLTRSYGILSAKQDRYTHSLCVCHGYDMKYFASTSEVVPTFVPNKAAIHG